MEEGTGNGCIVMVEYRRKTARSSLGLLYNITRHRRKAYCAVETLLWRITADFGTFIGSVDGTHCEDQFFSNDPSEYGPFESEAACHEEGLVRALF